MRKYQENLKYGKFIKCEIENMENLENVKEDNINKRESIVGGDKCKNPKGFLDYEINKWNEYNYYYY